MSITEDRYQVDEYHNVILNLVSRTYTALPPTAPAYVNHVLSVMHYMMKTQLVSMSVDKGFPYITYAPGEQLYEKRMLTRLGRWYKSQADANVEDHKLGEAISLLQAIAAQEGYVLDENVSVVVLRGEDIVDAYRAEKGGHSCMTGSKANYVKFYALNPNQVGLALYNDSVRAILWTVDTGEICMDRVYPNSGFRNKALRNWALEQGYYVRNHDALPCDASQHFVNKDGRIINDATVTFENYAEAECFPYMDTFYMLDPNLPAKRLFMRRTEATPGSCWTLTGQGGGPLYGGNRLSRIILQQARQQPQLDEDDEDDEEPWGCCAWCDVMLPTIDDAYSCGDDNICERCYERDTSHCEHCDSTVHSEDTRDVDGEVWCEHCTSIHATSCYECSEYTNTASAITTTDDIRLCPDCAASYRCTGCQSFTYNGTCECGHEQQEEPQAEATGAATAGEFFIILNDPTTADWRCVEQRFAASGDATTAGDAGAAAAGTDDEHQGVVRG